MLRSEFLKVGGTEDLPDYVYYNADIINNTTADLLGGQAFTDPQIRFNETRDFSLIKDCSQYYFSIIRFTMDGPNKDLPLFIPDIQESTGQTNVNLTSYSVSIPFQQSWRVLAGAGPATKDVLLTILPQQRFVQYASETQNPVIAPIPESTANVGMRRLPAGAAAQVYNAAYPYQIGDVFGSALDPVYNTIVGPYYRVNSPATWSSTTAYAAGAFVSYLGKGWVAVAPAVGVAPGVVPGQWTFGVVGFAPPNTTYYQLVDANQGSPQDLSSRYYWVYTYQHWIDLVNQTLLLAHQDLFAALQVAWNNPAGPVQPSATPFPYANFAAFQAVVQTPQIVFNQPNHHFKIYADSDGFGPRLTTFTPTAPGVVGAITSPQFRLFFNSNMFGLFTNYNNIYYNTPTLTGFNLPALTTAYPVPATGGYVNEILFTNKFYQNVADFRLSPYAGVPPLGFVPVAAQKVYYIADQDTSSDDTLWSPISSIVFTSTLIPIRAEQTGVPVELGRGNLGFSAPTTQSAFQPIITDIALPMTGGASDYRQFIFYSPSAEYRLSDFGTSKQDLRNVDIQVFWKNRLDNKLYPIQMFNLSSVSIKVMFRHKDAASPKDKGDLGMFGAV